jgi:hypothetical protein
MKGREIKKRGSWGKGEREGVIWRERVGGRQMKEM